MIALVQILVAAQFSAAVPPDPLMQAIVMAVETAAALPDSRVDGRKLVVDTSHFRALSGASQGIRELPAGWGTYDQAKWERCANVESGATVRRCYHAARVYVQVTRVSREPDGSLVVIGMFRSLRPASISGSVKTPQGASRSVQGQLFRVELTANGGAWTVSGAAVANLH